MIVVFLRPFLNQVALVLAVTLLRVVFRISDIIGQELQSATTEHHLKTVACGPVDQLVGNVLAALAGFVAHVLVTFPVAVDTVGIGGCRCGVGDAGGCHDSGGQALGFSRFEN